MAGGRSIPTTYVFKDDERFVINKADLQIWLDKGFREILTSEGIPEKASKEPSSIENDDSSTGTTQVPAVAADFKTCTLAQLKAVAREMGIEPSAGTKRDDLQKILTDLGEEALEALEKLSSGG